MPNYAVAQSGGLTPPSLNIAALYPGDGIYFLFNSTDLPVATQASVVIERGQGAVMSDQGTTFEVTFTASNAGNTIVVLGSNNPNLQVFTPGDWVTLGTIGASKLADSFTATDRFRFYCVQLTGLAAGQVSAVTAKR